MPLVTNSYGKSRVRLTRVTRQGGRHDLKEFTVAVQLEGAFEASYTLGDNRSVVATDSMKNTVYVLAKKLGVDSAESFAIALARHFVETYKQVRQASIEIEEHLWNRLGGDHPHAFVGGGSESRTAKVVHSAAGTTVVSGLSGLLVLKTTDSAFVDFVRDEYTTLPDAHDRIFATAVTATWPYSRLDADWDHCHRVIRQSLIDIFASHKSLGVQHTLLAMGEAALAACSAIDEITIVMPNKHRIPMNLTPFGLTNDNEVFVATDEPHGLISGTIRR